MTKEDEYDDEVETWLKAGNRYCKYCDRHFKIRGKRKEFCSIECRKDYDLAVKEFNGWKKYDKIWSII